MIKFNKFHVIDKATGKKARVFYSLDNRIDGRKCVTLYAKDYERTLQDILADSYHNETDLQTDYFDQGKAVLFEDHPLYAVARKTAEANKAF